MNIPVWEALSQNEFNMVESSMSVSGFKISHVKKDFKGIFICKRSPKDFKNKVNYILKNYKQILKQIKRNKIHSKQEFQNNLSRIVT